MYDLEEPGQLMRALRRTIWPPQCASKVPEPCGLYGLIPSPQVWRHLAASASLIALKASIGSRQRFSIQPGIRTGWRHGWNQFFYVRVLTRWRIHDARRIRRLHRRHGHDLQEG